MGTTTHALIQHYAAYMTDRTEHEELPTGWQALVSVLFRDVAEVLLHHPEVRLTIDQVREKWGGLRIHVRAGEGDAADAAMAAVQPIIAAAEARSVATCQVCGALGRRRRSGGRIATLCDAHDRQPTAEPDGDDDDAWQSEWLSVAYDREADEAGPAQERSQRPSSPDAGATTAPARAGLVRLYTLRGVADALGLASDLPDDELVPARTETEHEGRLAAILRAGEAGTWRELARPTPACLTRLDTLDTAAPHMGEVTALVRRHVQAALAIGLHIQLPPLMLLGEPGMGKTWYLSHLGVALGVPTRSFPMSGTTLGEGLQGSHPSWRNAAPGLVARTLLQEKVANPVILLDEADKPGTNSWNSDPYRAFYGLLEPAGARTFRDEYLGFDLDAGSVSWILAGNSLTSLPEPIRDRLTILEVPAISRVQLAAIVTSIYAEANAAAKGFFDADLEPGILDVLLTMSPRAIRKAVQDAMVRAAAGGRRRLGPDDLKSARRTSGAHYGFRMSQL